MRGGAVPGGVAKRPRPCEWDSECLDMEACYNGVCEDLCGLANLCAPSARCHVVKHRPVCTCPPGYQGNPALKCFLPQPCKVCQAIPGLCLSLGGQKCITPSCEIRCLFRKLLFRILRSKQKVIKVSFQY